MNNPDTFEVEILDDGSIKLSTDKVSNANHTQAESFLKEVCRMAGGVKETKTKAGHHGHTHSHGAKAHTHG